jgi:hypothetical protein
MELYAVGNNRIRIRGYAILPFDKRRYAPQAKNKSSEVVWGPFVSASSSR